MSPCRERGLARASTVGILTLASCLTLGACAGRRLPLPSDTGSPLPDYAAVHDRLAAACRGVRTLSAEIRLRGRAGRQRLNGRLLAGFERPDSMRLEAVAPFGSPAFILAARGAEAVLLLPREDRVVMGERADAILGALTGVALAPADLQAILDGCVVSSPRATGGRLHAGGWASVELDGGARIYLRRAGDWQVRAARRDTWQVEYGDWQGAFPRWVRLRSERAPVDVDVTATLSQLEVNADIPPSAFTVAVPATARVLSLDELRDAGPLGGP